MKKKATIVDIDGTMAIRGDRGIFQWDAVESDTPYGAVVMTVQALSASGLSIVFCSGRMEKARAGTQRWLDTHYGLPYAELFMRSDEDLRRDSVVKLEIYRNYIEPTYDVQMVIDDRDPVVSMWRNEVGLPCFQVAEGNF